MAEGELSEAVAVTPEQQEIGDFLVEASGLGEFANRRITMFEGQPDMTIRDGLGLCADRIAEAGLTPTDVKAWIMTRLGAVEPPTPPPASASS